jgi:hypothetical protein
MQEAIPHIIAAVAAVAACAAAWAAMRSARCTQKSIEGGLFRSLLAEYGGEKMLHSLRLLAPQDPSPDALSTWFTRLQQGKPEAIRVDKARRYVKYFYLNALLLYHEGYISERNLEELYKFNGIGILINLVRPMEKLHNEKSADLPKMKEIEDFCYEKNLLHQLRDDFPVIPDGTEQGTGGDK